MAVRYFSYESICSNLPSSCELGTLAQINGEFCPNFNASMVQSPSAPAKKSVTCVTDFFICVRRTQHHWAKPTSFVAAATTSLSTVRTQMNDVALRANEVLRNEDATLA